MNDSVIELKSVCFSINHRHIIEDIDLDIKRGEYVGIIGPNGSGKTTLLRILLGLLKAKTGSVSLFGVPLAQFRDWHQIGYVPQKASTSTLRYPITASEVVGMGLSGLYPPRNLILKALQLVNMEEYEGRLVSELSGGQQQRIFIARALVSNPSLLILDEPTAGVDIKSQVTFYELLKKLNLTLGLTLVLVSHDLEVVAHEASHVVCINRKLICHGHPKEVLQGNFLEKLYGRKVQFISHNH